VNHAYGAVTPLDPELVQVEASPASDGRPADAAPQPHDAVRGSPLPDAVEPGAGRHRECTKS